MNAFVSQRSILAFLLIALAPACVGELSIDAAPGAGGPSDPITYGSAADQLLASDLETWLADRASWPAFSGLDGFQAGTGAHGVVHRFRLNAIAAAHPEAMPSGSIVACESYASADDASLASIAVMQRVDGYDATEGDWFWAQLDAAGVIAKDAHGVPMAGRIGPNRADGCIGCHASAPGSDFVYSNGGAQ